MMPEAESFNALGAGNGFPLWGKFVLGEWEDFVAGFSCLSKVDVSGYDHVAPMTIEQASKMFWNLAKTDGSASYVPNSGDPTTVVTATNLMTGYATDPDAAILLGSPALVPKLRLCNRVEVTNPSNFEFGQEVAMLSLQASNPLSFPEANPAFVFTRFSRPFRYYNGVTTDEDNFIGYGLQNSIPFAQAGATSFDGTALDYYASSIRFASSYPEGTFSEGTVSDIPVLIFTQTDGNEGSSSASLGTFDSYTYP